LAILATAIALAVHGKAAAQVTEKMRRSNEATSEAAATNAACRALAFYF
jgi:hypothetical protein